MTRYTQAEKLAKDDFGVPFTHKTGEEVYDAKTRHGPWATMTKKSFLTHSIRKLGTGYGQKYVRNSAGELHKVES